MVGVRPGGQDGGQARYVGQGLGVVLPRHAGRLDVHASQQRHPHWAELLGGSLLLPLLGSSVLKPNLPGREVG